MIEAKEFTELLGIEVVKAADGEVVLDLVLSPLHMSRAARVHGGVLFTLLDTALGRAVLTALPEGRGCATVECKINYFRPIQSGSLRTVGRLINLTRRTGYSEGEVRNGEGKLIARASGTFMLTDTLEQAERERI